LIRHHCPTCALLLQAPATDAGKSARCPFCGQKLEIPAALQLRSWVAALWAAAIAALAILGAGIVLGVVWF